MVKTDNPANPFLQRKAGKTLPKKGKNIFTFIVHCANMYVVKIGTSVGFSQKSRIRIGWAEVLFSHIRTAQGLLRRFLFGGFRGF